MLLVTTRLAQQSAATATLTTAPGASCPMNTDCASYTLSVPALNPSVGAFSTSGNQTPAAPAAGAVDYTVDAVAFIPGSSSTPDCSHSDRQTSQTTNTPLAATAGGSLMAATLALQVASNRSAAEISVRHRIRARQTPRPFSRLVPRTSRTGFGKPGITAVTSEVSLLSTIVYHRDIDSPAHSGAAADYLRQPRGSSPWPRWLKDGRGRL